MGVIPNPKMAFIFPISCILALIFPILIKYFPKCVGKGSFPKSQIKSLFTQRCSCHDDAYLTSFCMTTTMAGCELKLPISKVRKTAKIRNQYNQVPHLTQDTTWESDNITIRHHKQEPSSLPARQQ